MIGAAEVSAASLVSSLAGADSVRRRQRRTKNHVAEDNAAKPTRAAIQSQELLLSGGASGDAASDAGGDIRKTGMSCAEPGSKLGPSLRPPPAAAIQRPSRENVAA